MARVDVHTGLYHEDCLLLKMPFHISAPFSSLNYSSASETLSSSHLHYLLSEDSHRSLNRPDDKSSHLFETFLPFESFI